MEIVGDNGKVSIDIVTQVFQYLAEKDRSVNATGIANVHNFLFSLTE